MADANGFRGPWEKLVDLATQQTAQGERVTLLLEQLVQGQHENMLARERAVGDIKAHVEATVKTQLRMSEAWWRRAFVSIGILITIANLFGVAVDKWLGLFPHH